MSCEPAIETDARPHSARKTGDPLFEQIPRFICLGQAPLHRDRLGVFGLLRLRRIPLVSAFETLPEIATRLRVFHLRSDEAALRTLLVHRLVPSDEIAVLVRARVERRSTFSRTTLDELTAVLRTEHTRRQRPRPTTLRERAAAEELAAAALTNDHRRAAEMTLLIRHHRLGFLAFDRP